MKKNADAGGKVVPQPDLRRHTEEDLHYRDNIYAAIAKASSLFVSSTRTDYNAVLQIMGESVSVNRAYVFQIHEDGSKVSNTFEWCPEGTDPQIDILQDLETSRVPWWMEQLIKRRNIVIGNVDELPPEANAEESILKDQQIQSLVVVPIWSRAQTLLGFMGFDDTEKKRDWTRSEVEVLQIAGEMISSDLERRAVEDQLAFERAQLLSIFDGLEAIVLVADLNTYEILYVNQPTKDSFQKELVGGICYREFQGREAPCEFCTNEIILRQKPIPYRWENYNPILGKHYDIIDRVIKWPDGRDVRFEFAVDISERKQAEYALQESRENLRKLNERLEMRVQKRTAELEVANLGLRASQKRITAEKKRLQQKNIALQEVLGHLEGERSKFRDEVAMHIEKSVLPVLNRLVKDREDPFLVVALRRSLDDLLSSRLGRSAHLSAQLTVREEEVCRLVTQGMSVKEISQALNCSIKTVERHRRSIEKKLGIMGTGVDLVSYLKNSK